MDIRKIQVLVLLILASAGCENNTGWSKEEVSFKVRSDGQDRSYVNGRSPTDENVLPFSSAVQVGNTLYISGTLGLDPGQKVPATPEAEAKNIMDNIQNLLEDAGMTMDDLVAVQVFSSDVSDYDAFNSIYRTYFNKEFPARAYVGSGTLLFGARFEVLGTAVKR